MTTEDRAQENAARFAFSVNEGDPFTQDAWDDAKNAALRALQSRRYLGAKIVRSQARVNPRTHHRRSLGDVRQRPDLHASASST